MDQDVSAAVEREFKFDVSTSFAMPRLDEPIQGVHAAPPVTKDLHATYFDTSDLRLARNGITLRHRSGDVRPWTLKLPDQGTHDALERFEIEFPGVISAMPSELSDIVLGYSMRAPLSPVIRLHSRRTTHALSSGGRQLVDVVDDVVEVHDRHDQPSGFREVEVEFSEFASSELVQAVINLLKGAGALPSQRIPKAIRALGPDAQLQPDVPFSSLDPNATPIETAHALTRRGVATLLSADIEARAGVESGVDRLRTVLETLPWLITWIRPLLTQTVIDDLERSISALRELLAATTAIDAVKQTLASDDYLAQLAKAVDATRSES